MQLDTFIRDLQRLRNLLPPETEIRFGASGYGNHTYDILDMRFTPVAEHVEPEHTCDGATCTCTPSDGLPLGNCPLCDCEGCCDDEPETVIIYLMEGNQDPYSLPETIDEDELKQRLGE